MKKARINISGMSCASCAAKIEKKLNSFTGVLANVNFAANKATVEISEPEISVESLIEEVNKLGFKASFSNGSDLDKLLYDAEVNRELKFLKISFIISLIFSLPLFSEMFVKMAGFHNTVLSNPVLQLVLASVVQFGVGFKFYKNSYKALKNLAPGMDVLVALGTSAAFFFQCLQCIFQSRKTCSSLF